MTHRANIDQANLEYTLSWVIVQERLSEKQSAVPYRRVHHVQL